MVRDSETILGDEQFQETADWLATWTGPAAVVVALTVVVSGALTTHWFSWTANALTDLGHPRADHAWLVNLGLLAAGSLGSVFVARLSLQSRNAGHVVGGVALLASTATLAGTGAFPRGTALHGVATFGFVASLCCGLLAYAVGDVVDDETRRGVVTTWLATTVITAWGVWGAVGRSGAVGSTGLQGSAIPQFVALLALGGFVALSTQRLRRRIAGTNSSDAGSEDPEPV